MAKKLDVKLSRLVCPGGKHFEVGIHDLVVLIFPQNIHLPGRGRDSCLHDLHFYNYTWADIG